MTFYGKWQKVDRKFEGCFIGNYENFMVVSLHITFCPLNDIDTYNISMKMRIYEQRIFTKYSINETKRIIGILHINQLPSYTIIFLFHKVFILVTRRN